MAQKSKKATAGGSLEALQKALRSVEADRKQNPQADLTSQLESAGILNPLVVVSPESFRIQRLVAFIHERLFLSAPQAIISAHGAQLNQNAELSSFLGNILTPSLFGGPQLLVIWNAEKLKAATEKSLLEALKRPLRNQLLIAAAESPPKNAAPLQGLAAIGTSVTLSELQGDALKRWISKEVERFGVAKSVEPSVLDTLARSFEGNLSGLLGELQRLSLFAGKDQVIEARHLQGAALPAQEQTGNELIRAIFGKDRRAAFFIANTLLESGVHPLQISAQLSKALRALLAEKGSSTQRHKDVNAPWLLKQVGGHGIGEGELLRGIEIVKALDLALKDSGLEPEDTLHLAIEHLCRSLPGAAARAA